MSCPCCSGEINPHKSHHEHQATLSVKELAFLALGLLSLLVSFFMPHEWAHEIPFYPLTDPAWLAVILCGSGLYKTAFVALFKRKKITSSLLISIAMTASILLQVFVFFGIADVHGDACGDSYIFAAGEVAWLMMLGETLEIFTLRKAHAGVEKLVRLSPKTAERIGADGVPATVPVEDLQIGDIVQIAPDEAVPVDGEIVEGSSSVNQANMTGESVPVEKTVGDHVLAGTRNLQGALKIRVGKRSGDTALARLIDIVEEAENHRAPIQNIADKWAAVIVPAAIVFSVLVWAFAYFVLDCRFDEALVRGVTILVVFCPCAFALATPTAIAAGIGAASRHGVLVKTGAALEALATVNHIAFDKTGTLTTAELKINKVWTASGYSQEEIITLCAAAESRSRHPIAKAFKSQNPQELPNLSNIKAQSGIGITAWTDDHEKLTICSQKAYEAIKNEAADGEQPPVPAGTTLVYALLDNKLVSVISFVDTVRGNAKNVVEDLKKSGITTTLITGDNKEAASSVAESVGVENIFAEQMPADKAKIVRQIKNDGKIMMVGDGVNDAPALVSADVGMAMNAVDADAQSLAIESADIALLNNKLELVPALIRFSRTIMRTIHLNFAFSICLNLAAVILSAAGILDPVTGAILHNCSSLLVVGNSALLLVRTWK
ncbi:MAG: cation-translocating P-type ATPase [Opitutales bacterium]|nr:cation-translocating P-type ATPase [Opitutales bacterium]